MGRCARKLLALTALAVAALCSAVAAASPPAWRVATGADAEMWLLGSVHLLREQDHPLPPIIDTLYNGAEVVVFELDLDDLDPAATQTEFLSAAMLADGSTLAEHLSPAVYERAQAATARLGFELRLLERFQPWFAAITLLEIGLQRQGIRAENGVEHYLLGKAVRDGKSVLGLETVAEQLAVFAELSADEQQGLLEQSLDELDAPTGTVDELIDAWRDGRFDVLTEELGAEFERFPELYAALVVERNQKWIDVLEAHLTAPEPRLVVVGALHLVGEHSVIDLLRERGWSVEPAAP